MIEESTDQSPLLDGFCLWMRCHRGVRESTLDLYLPLIRDFLSEVGEEPGLYDAAGVRAAILSRAKCCGLARVRSIGTAVRMFLRYLATQGLCSPSLAYAIPAQAHWRLSSLPRYLPAQDVTQVVDACDPATRKGARDRAIVLLLARLGLRAGDIADLRISDIDWKGARLRVMGKSRRETWLPLPQGAGDDDHVFLRVKPPFDSFSGSSAVSKVVASAIKRSGVSAPSMGAHLLRHSAATEMLRQGASLDMIGTVLIHNSVETTLLYAKVDVERLQMIAQPWPDQEVTSC
jgi:integrase/recombinase XerD